MSYKPKPCPECQSVLCHRSDCSLGQAHRREWAERDAARRGKALDAPPVNKMVAEPARKK